MQQFWDNKDSRFTDDQIRAAAEFVASSTQHPWPTRPLVIEPMKNGDVAFLKLAYRLSNASGIWFLSDPYYVYSPDTSVIMLRKTDESDIYQQSVMVHEVVHHFQYRGGRIGSVSAVEPEAYETQAVWLKAQGADPDKEFGFNVLERMPIIAMVGSPWKDLPLETAMAKATLLKS